MPAKPRRRTATKKALHTIANGDTPDFVNFPPTWAGILSWLFGRLGIATIFIISSYGLYQDQKEDKDFYIKWLDRLNVERSKENKENSELLKSLAKTIEDNTKAINEAHRRQTSN